MGPRIAYFSMEIAVASAMRTYSGGLGVLAGDAVRAAADLGLPLCAVTLVHRKGYFRQAIDAQGRQLEDPDAWPVQRLLREEAARASVWIEEREVKVRAWRADVTGAGGAVVPVYFLDTDLPENAEQDRALTDVLYGGDERYRLSQEIVLGVGGVRMLRALGHSGITCYHMNEGHAALLGAELLLEEMAARNASSVEPDMIESVRRQCVFTTHTPLAAGHDTFRPSVVRPIAGRQEALERSGLFAHEGSLHMTYAALNLSRYANAVSRRHGEVSRRMFPGYAIDWITNGVHAATWVCGPVAAVLDRHSAGWAARSGLLVRAAGIPVSELLEAHGRAKRSLIEEAGRRGVALRDDAFTIGCARRATGYKRLDLLLRDPERLRALAARNGPIQVVYAGKAHPRDEAGKAMIERIVGAAQAAGGPVRIAFLSGYDMDLARLLVSGCDVWLNTPEPPLEASGTSGMKAAMNGVPSLSTLDGWWVEGCLEGITGWAIGEGREYSRDDADAASLYEKLGTITALYAQDREGYGRVMRGALALNGSRFNAQRMMEEYAARAYAG